MGLTVLLVEAQTELPLTPTVLDRLGALGITNVSLVRDDATFGLVLEGWAFDPRRSTAAAVEAVATAGATRALYPVVQMAVSTVTTEGGIT